MIPDEGTNNARAEVAATAIVDSLGQVLTVVTWARQFDAKKTKIDQAVAGEHSRPGFLLLP